MEVVLLKKPRAKKSDTQNGSNLLLCKFAKHENYEKNITQSVTTLDTKIALYSEHLNQGITKLIKLFTDQYTVDSEAYGPNGEEEHTAVGDKEDETFVFPDIHAQLFIFQLFFSQPCRATTYLLHSKTLQVYVIFTRNIVEQLHTSSSAKPLKYYTLLTKLSLLPILFKVAVPYGPFLADVLTLNAVLLLAIYSDRRATVT
jgi:hypothetical protein